MKIEEELFKKYRVNFNKLTNYGFGLVDNLYYLSKPIFNGDFEVGISISQEGILEAKIFDTAFGEEYLNHNISSINGEFVNQVRQEYEELLIEIRNNCFEKLPFIFDQTNRIVKMIEKKYHDLPEFVFKEDDNDGIFRNQKSKKWYGIIMKVNGEKLGLDNLEIEVINVKLQQELITSLLSKKGYYKAYHMNKKYWISIVLDDSLTDQEIMDCIEMSHSFTC